MTQFRMPSAAELYAYEQRARRERAEVQAALVASAFAWIGRQFLALFTKPYAARPKVVTHA